MRDDELKLLADITGMGVELVQLRERCETLKLEAQIHAQEARTANATITEIYQLCTGGSGEPGNWNGAEPVRKLIAERDALRAECASWKEMYHAEKARIDGAPTYDAEWTVGYGLTFLDGPLGMDGKRVALVVLEGGE
jgi:hypothetical protein